jgi:hypothetical protein
LIERTQRSAWAFKLGLLGGIGVHSTPPLASVRGPEVEFEKNAMMDIKFGSRKAGSQFVSASGENKPSTLP